MGAKSSKIKSVNAINLNIPKPVNHMDDLNHIIEVQTIIARLAILTARSDIISPTYKEYNNNREKFSYLVHDVDYLQFESNVIFDLICAKKYETVLKMEKSYVKLIKNIKDNVLILQHMYNLTRYQIIVKS